MNPAPFQHPGLVSRRPGFGRRQFILGATTTALLVGCGDTPAATSTAPDEADAAVAATTLLATPESATFDARFEGVIRSGASRTAWESVVSGFENFDIATVYDEAYSVHTVSKKIQGEWRILSEEVQTTVEGQTSTVLKQAVEFREEVESGPCDSELSLKILDGAVDGSFVAAFADGDPTNRGVLDGLFLWSGSAANMVGLRTMVLNTGTRQGDVVTTGTEVCNNVGHGEGTIRAVITEGEESGSIVEGTLTMEFVETFGGYTYDARFEGVIRTASRLEYQAITTLYEDFDTEALFEENYALHSVSKQVRGRWLTASSALQTVEGQATPVLKRSVEFEEEIGSGPCESPLSQQIFDGINEGAFVLGFADDDASKRGTAAASFTSRGSRSNAVGTRTLLLNGGSHFHNATDAEACARGGYGEGMIRAAITEGEGKGSILDLSLTIEYVARG